MKCPFCTAENPPHANFCLNCGSPLDLKACKGCGSINRKNAVACQMCGVSFDEPAVEPTTPASVEASHVEEAEALAKETLTFKKLFAEIEQDVNEQLAPARAAASSNPPDIEDQEESIPTAPLAVEPPSYLQEMLAQRAATTERGSRGWRVLTVVLLLFAFGGAGYYALTGHDAAFAKWKSLISIKSKTGPRTSEPAASSDDTSVDQAPPAQSPSQTAPVGNR